MRDIRFHLLFSPKFPECFDVKKFKTASFPYVRTTTQVFSQPLTVLSSNDLNAYYLMAIQNITIYYSSHEISLVVAVVF